MEEGVAGSGEERVYRDGGKTGVGEQYIQTWVDRGDKFRGLSYLVPRVYKDLAKLVLVYIDFAFVIDLCHNCLFSPCGFLEYNTTLGFTNFGS
nr:hypothetical protein [Tanacetum cinerariifolium]